MYLEAYGMQVFWARASGKPRGPVLGLHATVDSKKLEYGCRVIYAGATSFSCFRINGRSYYSKRFRAISGSELCTGYKLLGPCKVFTTCIQLASIVADGFAFFRVLGRKRRINAIV